MKATWPWLPIGDLFEIGAGKTMSAEARAGADKVPFLRTSNVLWDRIDLTVLDEMSMSADERQAKSLAPGDLLVCEGGEIGRAAVWDGDLSPVSFQNHVHRLRPKVEGLDPRFYVYFLQAAFTQLGIFEGVGNRTTIPNLSSGRLAALEAPVPPIEEQRAITLVLRSLRNVIDANGRALTTAEELHAAVMAHVFTYGLRGEPTKETEIGPIPESWEAESLGSVADIVSTRMSYADLERLEPSVDASAIPVWGVKVSDMNTPGNEVIFASASLAKALDLATAQQRAAPPDTVLLPKRGAAIATNKKRLAVVWTVFDPNVIGIRAKTGLDTKYLFHWLRSFDLRSITAAGPTPQINKKDLDPVCLPIPSVLEDQQMISSLIDSIDEVIRVSRAKKVLLEELFQSLLQRFFGEDQDDIDFEALAAMLGERSVA